MAHTRQEPPLGINLRKCLESVTCKGQRDWIPFGEEKGKLHICQYLHVSLRPVLLQKDVHSLSYLPPCR